MGMAHTDLLYGDAQLLLFREAKKRNSQKRGNKKGERVLLERPRKAALSWPLHSRGRIRRLPNVQSVFATTALPPPIPIGTLQIHLGVKEITHT